LRLAAFPAEKAEKAEKAEGKIEEHGTAWRQFQKLSLSAHWLGGRFRHCCFEAWSATISQNALALLGFDRHRGRRLYDFRRFQSEAHS
jgi:hypothetical protein